MLCVYLALYIYILKSGCVCALHYIYEKQYLIIFGTCVYIALYKKNVWLFRVVMLYLFNKGCFDFSFSFWQWRQRRLSYLIIFVYLCYDGCLLLLCICEIRIEVVYIFMVILICFCNDTIGVIYFMLLFWYVCALVGRVFGIMIVEW